MNQALPLSVTAAGLCAEPEPEASLPCTTSSSLQTFTGALFLLALLLTLALIL